MVYISPQDLTDLSNSLYSAVFDDTHWASVAEVVRRLVNTQHVALGFFDHQTSQHSMLHGDCAPEFERSFGQLVDINPFSEPMQNLPAGGALIDQQIIASDAFERSAFFAAWMRPQDMHSGLVHKINSRERINGYLALNRGGHIEKYDQRDLAVIGELAPILAHAINLRVQFGRRMMEQTGAVLGGRGIGWVAVTGAGRLVWANEAAEALFAEPGSAVSGRLGTLRLVHPLQMREFMAALQRACAPVGGVGADMIASHPETGSAVALSIVPAHNLLVQGLPVLRGAHIALRNLSARLPPGFEDRIRAMFDLTPKEAALAAALASGRALGDVARANGVSILTVRTQLAHLFRKTDTRQQSQLVSLLLAVEPLPQP
ncbi:LuxR family transcriptional regulator [Devosia yakushimensis]|uniref:LuxR family transcriptional regulator n=1 Tax=Devosia yakushimensis TaxID=470028 RepID=A0ABQ5UJ92_9HYPH|nr:helix-turn-helix transcriptional regulator [Devosia yakushimensis]GLQ11714.1 LuxR family transcriptional regulator [Devosia yakushimensis]